MTNIDNFYEGSASVMGKLMRKANEERLEKKIRKAFKNTVPTAREVILNINGMGDMRILAGMGWDIKSTGPTVLNNKIFFMSKPYLEVEADISAKV